MTIDTPALLVSVVSHAQAPLVRNLLEDLKACRAAPFRLVLTLNVPEALPFDVAALPYPVELRRNAAPRGYGANHNAAFAGARERYFAVLNPDIRLPQDPFPALLARLADPAVAAVAPRIRNPAGGLEDHARAFPTLASLFLKFVGVQAAPPETRTPDWIAGMFMLFRSEAFAACRGFDEGFFMYYEDVDLCARLRAAGLRVEVEPAAAAIHDARRASRRDLRHMRWHAASMARYFRKRWTGLA